MDPLFFDDDRADGEWTSPHGFKKAVAHLLARLVESELAFDTQTVLGVDYDFLSSLGIPIVREENHSSYKNWRRTTSQIKAWITAFIDKH